MVDDLTIIVVAVALMVIITAGAYILHPRDPRRKVSTRSQEKMSFQVFVDSTADLAPLRHAIKAVENAKAAPHLLTSVTLRDIGFIAAWDEHRHHIYHTRPIPTQVNSIQPYVQVYLTETQPWQFVFEVYDAQRALRLQHTVEKSLMKGYHLIIPPASLPVSTAMKRGQWTLAVRVNGQLLAAHRFGWRDVTSRQLDDHLDSDGEIGEDTLLLLAENYAAPLSLDDLLTGENREVGGNSR